MAGGDIDLTATDQRVERDSLGEVLVPAGALYGAQTQRAVQNFPISGIPVDAAVVRALAAIKREAAFVNSGLAVLAGEVAEAIATAADQVADGAHADQFPVDVFQTGSGTSTNMNVNEVIARLATRGLGRPVHPNDEVNASQSSNDTFPSAVHLAATEVLLTATLPALRRLAATFAERGDAFADVVKPGRTHLMDATPVTLGQEFGGYAAMLRHGIAQLESLAPRVGELPLGGTAVGTGVNSPAGFGSAVVARLRERTGLPLTEARDHFEAQGARDGLVALSGALRGVAVSLTKICNDLRWMGSGPNTGLAEIRLPSLQPGSSIMPGKVNPVLPEAVLQVCAQVVGHDATLAWAGASGAFELNVMVPVMSRAILEQLRLLGAAARVLADGCVAGIEPARERARALAESSPSVVTPLARVLGYDDAARIAKFAVANGTTIRQAVLELGFVERGRISEADLDRLLDVSAMTSPTPSPGA